MSNSEDHILYPIHRYGGGVDGLDSSDKGGICEYAESREEAEAILANIWGGGEIKEPIVVDYRKTLGEIQNKLSPLEMLVLRKKTGVSLRGHGTLKYGVVDTNKDKLRSEH